MPDQALSAQAASFHQQFVQLMNVGSAEYALAEAADASPLQTLQQDLLGAINAPTELLLGRPLIGSGGVGGAATGDGGKAGWGGLGGLVIGNGGAGGATTGPSGLGGTGVVPAASC